MKNRRKRKGGKVIADAADLQAPPRWHKLNDCSDLQELWANEVLASPNDCREGEADGGGDCGGRQPPS